MSQFSSRVEKGRGSWNSPDNQVDDAEMEDLFVGVIVGDLLLLFLDLPHQLLRLLDENMKRKQRKNHKHQGNVN